MVENRGIRWVIGFFAFCLFFQSLWSAWLTLQAFRAPSADSLQLIDARMAKILWQQDQLAKTLSDVALDQGKIRDSIRSVMINEKKQ